MDITNAELLEGFRIQEECDDEMETIISTICSSNIDQIRAVTWELVRKETGNDYQLKVLMDLIATKFPKSKQDMHVSTFRKILGSKG